MSEAGPAEVAEGSWLGLGFGPGAMGPASVRVTATVRLPRAHIRPSPNPNPNPNPSPNPNPNPNPIPNPNPRYIIGTIVLVLIIAVKLERDYADRYIYVWAIYASVVSSWTVIACRGLFSMIAQVPSDCAGQQCHHDELHWPCQSTIGH